MKNVITNITSNSIVFARITTQVSSKSDENSIYCFPSLNQNGTMWHINELRSI